MAPKQRRRSNGSGKRGGFGTWSIDRLITTWTTAKQELARASAQVQALEAAMRSRSDLTALATILRTDGSSAPRGRPASSSGRRTRSKGLANQDVLSALKAVSGRGKDRGVAPAAVTAKLGSGANPMHVRAALKRLKDAGHVRGGGRGRGAKYWLAR